jgi:hypothetical protein
VLLRNLAFNLVAIEHPLPDLELAQLLEAIRARESHSAEAPVLVLTREDPESLTAQLDDPKLTCHSLAASADELLMLLANRIGVAARRATRLLVHIKVQLGAARMLRVCQSVDISQSGLLVRTERPLPLETKVDLEFSLPYRSNSIKAMGRVVRHTDADSKGRVGLGIHFDSIGEEDRESISSFVADRSTTVVTDRNSARSQPS